MVWFNTCSVDGADGEWMWKNLTRSYTIEEIKNRTRHHKVTHVTLVDDIPPNYMNKLFPHLTHLRVYGVHRNANWTRYTSVII